jgi:hypothetical protein
VGHWGAETADLWKQFSDRRVEGSQRTVFIALTTDPRQSIEVDLGDQGLRYFRTYLTRNGAMASPILERLDRHRGRVITWAFAAADLPDDFDADLDPEVSKLQWKFAEDRIVAHLNQASDSIVVFEHPFAKPTDKWLHVKPVPYVSCGDNVLFIINRSWADLERAELALISGGAQQELGLFSRDQRLCQGLSGEIEPSVVKEIVIAADAVLLRAFDAEGYMLWLPLDSADKAP